MGKDTSNAPPQAKSVAFASTSGIFKKHKSHSQSKDKRLHPSGLQALPDPKHKKRKRKTEHPLSIAFSDNVENSRQKIEQGTKAQLDGVRDALVTQTHSSIQDVQDRKQKAHDSNRDLQRPLDDELLELTRKDGTVVTMTLGKRIDAYRKLVHREKQNLSGLFEQWEDVSKEINSLTAELFGLQGAETILKGDDAESSDFESVEQQALMAEMQAEIERARTAATAIGAKAVKLMKTGEKDLTVKHNTKFLQACNTMFGEDED